MSKILIQCSCLLIWFGVNNGAVYENRPKIKTSNGDLILEPALNKNIYFLPNGPKSNVYVGDVNILIARSEEINNQNGQVNHDLENLINGPNGVLKRLESIENKNSSLPDDVMSANLSAIWRRVNNINRKVNALQTQLNNIGRDECESDPCQHGGTCLSLAKGHHCLCPTNWEGRDCDVDVNECRNFLGTDLGCQNSATCINRPGSYECVCRSGWFGLHCTRKAKDCSGGDFEMCGHGKCVPVTTGEGITCFCQQGWTTNGTGVECLTDVNECDPNQGGSRCSVNPKVECINIPGSFRCGQCPRGYEGDGFSCSDIDECTLMPNGGCSPLVSCHNTVGSRICGPCPGGYEGDGVICTWKGSCSMNNGGCHPSARCIERLQIGVRATQCVCPNGMEGDGVGLNGCYIPSGFNNLTESCVNNPCGDHGVCHVLRTGYTCVCRSGYGGSHCDEASDLCASKPCRNGGSCKLDESATSGFRCECPAQYTGTICQILSRTCGGLLDAAEGNIVYPLTNNSYSHNVRCAWVIHTEPGKVINVTFSKFDIEGQSDCLYDFLQIHDGRNAAGHPLGRFCGKIFPKGGNLVSSDNYLYLWFRSDSSVSKTGFALHWTSVKPACGGYVVASKHGTITSPGWPSAYPPNRNCSWLLRTDFGKRIQIHFFELDIESHSNCSFDYLAVYDGMRESDQLLNKYCNTSQPAPLQSSGAELLIHFNSDSLGSGRGFQLAYAPVEGIPGCGGYYTASKGEIISPSYNGSYLGNMICEYKIKSKADTKIKIEFKDFRLETSLRCLFDYLKVYDGASAESPLVGKFCGNTYPKTYASSSNYIFLIFKSDSTVSSSGFKISYQTLCHSNLLGDSGVIKSPGYPFEYPRNEYCEYVISTTPGKAVQLIFQDFDIEDNTRYNCQYDNVEIRDGPDANATLLGRYCGGMEHIPPVHTSTHNYMYIVFRSDMSVSGAGFYANYTTIDTECGGIYRTNPGLINHPTEDDSVQKHTTYKNNQNCTWIIIAPESSVIKLTWNRFSVEKAESCGSDYLELMELDSNNDSNELGKFCGSKSPPALTSSTNILKLVFITDTSVPAEGFSVSYTFIDENSHCGGIYHKTHGYIYSPGWPDRYHTNQDCTWSIMVPVGQQIRLNISQFDLERPVHGNCISGDYLEIKNGASPLSPLQGQYCGKFNSKLIISLSNVLNVHFHSDYYLTRNGFKIEWDGSVIGCGGTLTVSSGSISSPNYPEDYNENSECFYKIVTSAGSRIRLSFTDLDLERTGNCRDDYVQIFDGKDSNAPSLGKYCYMTSDIHVIETSSNQAYIKFRADFYINGKGFLLNYYTTCNKNLTGRYGVIESPDYPNNYPLHLNCLWNISVPKGNKIKVVFSHFDLHKFYYSPFRFNHRPTVIPTLTTKCDSDFLQWYEPSTSLYSNKYCGNQLPPMVITKGNSLQIKFATGDYDSRTGFRLEWIHLGCGGHEQKSFGSVSVNSDLTSAGELECEWLIETSVGTSINLIVSEIYLSSQNNCSLDAVEIYNGQDVTSPLLTTLCQKRLYSVQSTSNLMFIRFRKHSSLRGASFRSSFSSAKATCGGKMDSLFGFITSKNYPKNYDSNMDCSWIISVPHNHRILLKFVDFDLYSYNRGPGKNNCGDAIKIFDSNSLSESNDMKLICPNSNVSTIVTKSNVIMIQFTTDETGTAKGFNINFSVTCGAQINASSDGIISNGNYIGGSNESCTWTIVATKPSQRISLTFTHLNLPKFSDSLEPRNQSCSSYIRVYDGVDIQPHLLRGEYCGKKAPSMIVSKGSAITVVLGTFGKQIEGYFSAHYSPLDMACGGVLTSEEGTIASPNFPQSYPNGIDCEWILSTSPGNRVYVTFEQFSLENSDRCNEDYLEIRENSGAGRLIGVYCGNEIPINTTEAAKLYIKFHSNSESSEKNIFLLHYGFLHGNNFIGIDQGEISSPLYPRQYLGAGEYAWRLLPNGPETIQLTIDALEIHSYSEICINKLTIYDGYDDTAPLLDELCGILPSRNKIIQTSSNVAYIKLTLDVSNSGAMFHMRWTKSNQNQEQTGVIDQINCGSNSTITILPGSSTVIQSPNYPNEYGNNLNCEWVYKATIGRHLKLQFFDFHLEERSGCIADYISVYSSNDLIQWIPIKEKQCKWQSENIETSQFLKMKFTTDSSVTNKGFRGQIKSLCGGVLTEASGIINPSWNELYDGVRYSRSIRCNWTVNVRPGRLIRLQFVVLNITNNDNACDTSVTIHNGETVNSPLLSSGRYCGYAHENKSNLITSSNGLYVGYVINKVINRELKFGTFKLYYEETNIECGVNSKLDSDHSWEIISSPNYAISAPLPYSECVWTFTGPPGEILRIDFIERFDLDDQDNCGTEVVELKDGISSISPTLGRFCAETPPTIKATGNMLYIKYSTQLAEPRNGFKANVSIDVCGGTIISENGEITSPGYPHMDLIPYNTTCIWIIRGAPGRLFMITPEDIDLPESKHPCATKVTVQDNIEDRQTTLLGTFCNSDYHSTITPFETASNEFKFILQIGEPSEWSESFQRRGFRFTYNSSRPMCGGKITASEGYLTTPSYPLETTIRYCQWFIESPNKLRRIRLELEDIQMEKYSIGIYNDKSFRSAIKVINSSNSSIARIYESSGNQLALYIWMRSVQIPRHKFKAKFSSDLQALCGGELIGLKGQITSPEISRSFSCDWHYDTKNPANIIDEYKYNTIVVSVKVNSTTSKSRCSYYDSKLSIIASVDHGMFLSRDYCSPIDTSLTIPSPVLQVKSTKMEGKSFVFNVDWKAQPCGGTVSVNEDAVNILEFPTDYNDSIDCAWTVAGPINNRVELKMEGEFVLDCDAEYVIISHGYSQTAPIIGKYCKGASLTAPMTTNFRYITVQYHSNEPNTTKIKLYARLEKGQCGGILSSSQRSFISPNYPKNYNPNQECTWTITADLGSRISLRFVDRFVIEDQQNCSKDVVIIYDWNNDKYSELARICGRQIPPPFNSTQNKMKVELRTNNKTNLDGFKALWTPICGGTYTASENEQILYSPGFPDRYPSMLDCSYNIIGPNDTKVLIKFIELELEGSYPDCSFDNLTITASSNYDYLQSVYCEFEIPPMISQFSNVSLVFKTDRYVQRRGFRLSYMLFKCGGQVKNPTALTSNVNEYYDGNMNCTWFIQAPFNKLVVLKFSFIDLEHYGDCNRDYVAVFDGLVIDSNKRIALLCGHANSSMVLRSHGSNLLLQFVSDESVNYFGFKVEVLFSYSESVGCGGQIDLSTSGTKTLQSFLLGNNSNYEKYLDCHWTITSPPDTIIKIEFTSFHVASCPNVTNQTALGFSKCDCDLVEIKDGLNLDSLIMGTFCGHTLPPVYYSSRSLMSIRLSTDGENESSGFVAKLSAQQPLCGTSHFRITDTPQNVTSPNFYNGVVARGLHCIYYLDAGNRPKSTIRITFINFDLQGSTNREANECNKDKLVVVSTPAPRNTSLGKSYVMQPHENSFFTSGYFFDETFPRRVEFCGIKKPADLYVTGSTAITLTTSLESDSKNYKGFQVEISFTGFCGRNYTDTQGRIHLPYDMDITADLEYETNDCYTLITAPENNTISAYFISVSPSYWNEDCYLDLFDGSEMSSNKLVSIKKEYENTYPVFSSGRYLLLHSHQDGFDQIYYDMNFVTTDKGSGCGGKLTNELGKVTSPLYPNIYRKTSSCEWELETPYGTRLKLRFTVFDLGKICDQNYVQLIDSKGKVISTYCSEPPADYTSNDNYVKIVFITTANNAGTGWVAEFVGIV